MARNAQQFVLNLIHKKLSANPTLLEKILHTLGAEKIRTGGKEIRSTCPLHRGKDPNFSLWYFNDVVTWRCHSRACGNGPIQTLIIAALRLNDNQAIAWLGQMAGVTAGDGSISIPAAGLDQIDNEMADRRFKSLRPQPYVVFPQKMVDFSMRRQHPLFLERGYPEGLLKKFQVGFVPANTWVRRDPSDPTKKSGWFEDRISIPIRLLDRTLIGFSGRRVDGLDVQKYKVLPGTMKSYALYGLEWPETRAEIVRTGVAIGVEGFSDVWRAWQFGVLNVFSWMGVDPSTTQVRLIEQLMMDSPAKSKYVVNYFDGDPPGRIASAKYADAIRNIVSVKEATPPDGLDPGDLESQEAFVEPLIQAGYEPAGAMHVLR